jgi:type II secretory pathway pseudopilin PulG
LEAKQLNYKKYNKNEQGSALITVLLVMVVLMILGAALMNTSVAENRFATKNEDRLQAYYIARTGAQAVAEFIIHGDASDIIGKTSEPNTQIGGGNFTVSVEEDEEDNIYNIISIGEYNGTTQTAKIRLTTTGTGTGGIFDYAIAAQSGITANNNVGKLEIIGNLASQHGPINLPGWDHPEKEVIDNSLIFPEINEPMVTPTYLGNITTTTPIEATGERENATYVSVGYISLQNNKIIITGEGSVHMYVDGDITLNTNSGFDIATNAKLYIYVTKPSTTILLNSGSGASNINVFLYAPDSHVDFQNASPNFSFEGAIIAKTVDLKNQITIKHNPNMNSFLEVDKTNIGVEYTGYTWYE